MAMISDSCICYLYPVGSCKGVWIANLSAFYLDDPANALLMINTIIHNQAPHLHRLANQTALATGNCIRRDPKHGLRYVGGVVAYSRLDGFLAGCNLPHCCQQCDF